MKVGRLFESHTAGAGRSPLLGNGILLESPFRQSPDVEVGLIAPTGPITPVEPYGRGDPMGRWKLLGVPFWVVPVILVVVGTALLALQLGPFPFGDAFKAHEVEPPPATSVHVVELATRIDSQIGSGLCRSLASALMLGYNVTLLTSDWLSSRKQVFENISTLLEDLDTKDAVDSDEKHERRTLPDTQDPKAAKPIAYAIWLSHHKTMNQPILLADAYDTIFQLEPKTVASDFYALTGQNASLDIVVSAEKNCWPFGYDEKTKPICRRAPPSPLEEVYLAANGLERAEEDPWDRKEIAPRWLNAGFLLGSPSSLLGLMRRTIARIEPDTDDQFAMLREWVEDPDHMLLDYYSQFCHTAHRSHEDLVLANSSTEGLESNFLWKNRVSGFFPAVIHFNGGGKDFNHPNNVWNGLWFQSELNESALLPGNLVDGDDGPLNYWETCRQYLYPG